MVSHPLSIPYVANRQKEFVNDCLERNWLSSFGKYTNLSEAFLADYCQVEYGQTCSNGTSALHLALLAAGAGEGTEVILPAFNSQYALFAVYHSRATPVIVDVNTDWTIDLVQLKKALSSKTRAVIIPHLFGIPNNPSEVRSVIETSEVIIIEDCAEAHGAMIKDKKIGSCGDIGCFSFYANKIISSGEGGMCITDSIDLSERIAYYKNQTFLPDQNKTFLHEDIGFNYRLSDLSAAVLYAQLLEIDTILEKRNMIEEAYKTFLENIFTFPSAREDCTKVNWMTIVSAPVETSKQRDELCLRLQKKGVPTRIAFPSLDEQPCLEQFRDKILFPIRNAKNISKKLFYLPTYTALSLTEVEQISQKVISAYEQFNKTI